MRVLYLGFVLIQYGMVLDLGTTTLKEELFPRGGATLGSNQCQSGGRRSEGESISQNLHVFFVERNG